MSPDEAQLHMADAERAFAERFPKVAFTAKAFSRLDDDGMVQGDWQLVGVIGVLAALERVQWIVAVNLVTFERRIVKGWQKAYALRGVEE